MTWENRIFLEVSSADPDSDTPVWVDLTSRIRDNVQPVTLNTGRQNDLDTSEPSVLQVLLDSSDDALTYGNTTGPYPWWGPGRRIRYREVIAGVNVPQFDGFITQINETVTTRGIEQRVAVTAIDRLGRLGTAPQFPSTLGAHILGSARNSALYGYWPLLDQVAPFAAFAGTTLATTSTLTGSTPPIEQYPHLEYRSGPLIPGDDEAPVKLVPGLNAGAFAYQPAINVNYSVAPFLAAGKVLTAVIWVSYDATIATDGVLTLTHFDGIVDLSRFNFGSGYRFHLTSPLGTLTGSTDSPDGTAAGTNRYFMVGFRYGFTPNVLELWVDDQVYTGVLAGVLAGPLGLSTLSTAPYGSAAHMQLYIGAPDDFTHDDFLAQRQVGLLGLERQTTGDRIRLIASYAGIPASQLNNIDTGSSIMQRARLAGQTPLDAMRDAERTEQGLLFCDGNGNLIFKDRRTLYNI